MKNRVIKLGFCALVGVALFTLDRKQDKAAARVREEKKQAQIAEAHKEVDELRRSTEAKAGEAAIKKATSVTHDPSTDTAARNAMDGKLKTSNSDERPSIPQP